MVARPVAPTKITVRSRQRSQAVPVRHIENLAASSLSLCLENAGSGPAILSSLEAVEVTLVSDRRIAALHRQFMGVPGPTDVITFDHGEIVISVETAARQATEFHQNLEQEVFRYVVHGLLHLNGHEDATEKGAAAMWRAQEQIVATYWRTPIGVPPATNK